MKIVRENINFDRGMNPKEAMGIGLSALVEKWMKKAFGDWSVDYRLESDGTITLNQGLEVMDADLSPGFPDYIKFGHIDGEIHLDACGLNFLKGLPRVTVGYFSCEQNNLTSLEGAPAVVNGDFFCRNNPGKFTKKYVESICRVINGEIYCEDNLVNEDFKEYGNFVKSGDVYSDLNMGKKIAINKWMAEMGIDPDEYKINDDFSITCYGDINLVDKKLFELPSYIKFEEIHGSFYAGGNLWENLEGFPKIIHGDLQIQSPSIQNYGKTRFTENEIRKIIEIDGNVYN
jgi:hypothetical protein